MKIKINLQTLIDRYEEGIATEEEVKALTKLIAFITGKTTHKGSDANRRLIGLQQVIIEEDYLKVVFKPNYYNTRLFYNFEKECVEYQTACHYPVELRSIKSDLLKAVVKQVSSI